MLKTSKKVVSVVLAVVLALSVLAMGASALSAGQVIGFVIVPDKDLTTLANNDTVTFTMYCDVADFNTLFSVAKLLFLYDSTAYAPATSYSNLGDFAAFYKDGTPSSLASNAAAWNNLKNGTTQDITGFDKAFVVPCAVDNTKDWDNDGVMNNANAGYNMTEDTSNPGSSVAQLQFTFTVIDNTKNLDVIICNNFATNSSLQYIKTTTGTKQTNLAQAAVDTSLASAMANNPAAAGPEVNYVKTQLKKNSGGYDVQMRITSVITDSDFDTYFPNTTTHGTDPAPTADALTSVGIVAFHGAEASFDEAAAKALVIDGTAATGYEAAETDYISKASDTADAYFGAILRGSRAAFENLPITFMGFARYIDSTGTEQVIFYPAAVEKTITTAQLEA